MQKKEKVVAVRLTEADYAALEWGRLLTLQARPKAPTMSAFIAELLYPEMHEFAKDCIEHHKKKAAAEKRKATKAAKKAANDPQ
jgi:hypothetical protein